MTKKQIDDLAETLANKVIEKLESRKKAWDEEFERNMQKQQDANDVAWNDWKASSPKWTTDVADIGGWEINESKFIDLETIAAEEKLRLQEDLKEHREILKKALEAQEYEHCRIIDKKIIEICEKLNKLIK
jgi:hypothetical protein|tara:strand:+ start:515 stop:907 length:393 start_codon:yes stop_codon:yes gene_type:complete